MKVLILSCNTGQGHNTAGRAVMEELERRGVQCEMRDALAFSSELTSKVISGTYIRMATDAPKVFGSLYRASDVTSRVIGGMYIRRAAGARRGLKAIYRAGERLASLRVKSPAYLVNMTCTKKMGRYIRENGFDAVLAPHVFPAQALTHLKRHGQIDAKIYFIATDYTCYPFSEETDMDGYFIAHEDMKASYAERGIPEDRLIPTGIPVSGRFAERMEQSEAREKLGIGPEKKMFLVMTGSMGAGKAGLIAETIASRGPEESVIHVMTGRNEAMRQEIEQLHRRDARIEAVPFTTDVALYMRAADVLITKPGGLTTSEAAAVNIPLVLSSPIPGCESDNAEFFEKKGMAVCTDDEVTSAYAAVRLAGNAGRRREMALAQAREINPRAAAAICDAVLK